MTSTARVVQPAEEDLGSCACPCEDCQHVDTWWETAILHERSAKERDGNHRHPRGHLRQSPADVTKGNSQLVLLQQAIERVENTLIRLNLLNLVVYNKLLDRLGRSRRAVKRHVADCGDGRRLVGQRLGDLEVVERRGANRPRVAEDALNLAVDEAELWRIGGGSEDGQRCVPRLVGGVAEAVASRVAAGNVDEPVLRRRWAHGRVDCQRLLPVLEIERMLDGLYNLGRRLLDGS